MRESYFYQLALTKKLRQLFVLVFLLSAHTGAWAEDYDLKVAGIQVTTENAAGITGTGINGTVSLSVETGETTTYTLTLEGATIDGNIESNLNLTVHIKGTNTITVPSDSRAAFVSQSGTYSPSLTFTSDTPLTDVLNINGIKGINNVASGYTISNSFYNSDSTSDWAWGWYPDGENPTGIKIYQIERYGLWLDSTQYTSEDLGAGQSGTPAVYNATNHTLTINAASLGSSTLKSSLPELIIQITGNENYLGSIVYEAPDQTSTGTLSFTRTKGEDCSLTLSTDISGFNVTYNNGLTHKTKNEGNTIYVIAPMIAPTISSSLVQGDNNYYSVTISPEEGTTGTVKYSIQYIDNHYYTDVNNGTYSESIEIKYPCTLTAWVEEGSNTSPTATAYRFGISPNPIVLEYGETAPTFSATVIPAVPGVTVGSFDGTSFATFNESVPGLTITGVGKEQSTANLSISYGERTFTAINDTIVYWLDVKPAAPVFSIEEGTYDGTQTLTLTSPYTTNSTIKYYIGEEPEYNNYSTYESAFDISESNTVTAWVEAKDSKETVFESEKVTKTYTIKQVATLEAENKTAPYQAAPIEFSKSDVTIKPESVRETLKEAITFTYYTEDPSEADTEPTPLESAPTDVGTYYVKISLEDNDYFTASPIIVTLTIEKADLAEDLSVSIQGWAFGETPDSETNAPSFSPALPDGLKASFEYKVKDANDETYQTFEISKSYPTAVGEYTLKAEVSGGTNYNDKEVTTDFNITTAAGGISYGTAEVNKSFGDEAFTIELTIMGDGTVTYSSDNEEVATVDEEGQVTIVGVGTANITATVEDSDNFTYETKSASYQLTVSAKSLEDAMVNVDATQTYTYTGSAIEPNVTVTLAVGGEALNPETDYTVAYTNNTNAATTDEANAPTVTVTGKGNYTGTITAKFNIHPKSIADESITIEPIEDQAYTGEAITPTITVKDGEKTLTKDTDYTVSYNGDNTNVTPEGSETLPSVIITGTGNYDPTTTKSATFRIKKANATIEGAEDQTVEFNNSEREYDLTEVTTTPSTLKDKLTRTYYESDPAKATDDSPVVQMSNLPINAGTYYVVISLTDDSYDIEPGGTVTKTYTINQVSLEGVTIEAIADQAFTGSAIEPTVTVTFNGLAVSAEDYTISYSSNTNAGEATVTLTSTNRNFTEGSTKTATFIINNRTIDAATKESLFEGGKEYASYYSATEDLSLGEGIAAYIIIGVSGNSVVTSPLSYIPKGVPVLLESIEDTSTETETATDGNMLHYATTATTVASSDGTAYVLYNNMYVRATNNAIPAGKSYLLVPATANIGGSARQLAISHGGDAAGIDAIEWNDGDKEVWFDLQGRRIDRPTKAGLYIKNGQKTVVK